MQRDLIDASPIPAWLQGQASAAAATPTTFAGERRALLRLQADLAVLLIEADADAVRTVGLPASTNINLALANLLAAEGRAAERKDPSWSLGQVAVAGRYAAQHLKELRRRVSARAGDVAEMVKRLDAVLGGLQAEAGR